MSKESTKKSAASKRKPRASKPVTPESNEAETSENWSADDSDGAETWTSVDLRLLLEDFRDGQSFYLEALQSALLQSMEARVLSAVQFRLGLEADIGDRGLRKIANSALSAGASGESRTREAAHEFLLEKSSNIDQKSFIKKLDEEFIESYTWIYLSKLKVPDGTLCEICKEALKAEKYLPLPAGKSVVSSEEESVYYVHLSCDFAKGMRLVGREMRSTRGAYEKQMRSIRQVLKAYYKNPNFYPEDHTEYFKLPDDYLLHDKKEFGNFLSNIYFVWSETTDVNKAFHPVYWSHLNEYAQAILEFRTKGEISKSTITKKLRKHIENEDRIESVYEYFVQNYSRSLGDTGKTASNPAIFKKISSPATPDNKKSESQKYENKSGVLHAVIHEYTLDTREQISEVFRYGYPVVLDTSKLPNDERQKLMDYSAGLIFGGGGEIHQISSTIYLLMPEHATLLYIK